MAAIFTCEHSREVENKNKNKNEDKYQFIT